LVESVNEAVFELHERGVVTSATMLVNGQAFESAASWAVRHPSLGVGLHFNITLGSPTAPQARIASLIGPDGRFPGRRKAEWRAFLGRINSDEIAVELEAQFEKLKASGIRPTHLDSHQHVHVLPGVWRVVADFARTHGLPVRCPRPGPLIRRPAGQDRPGSLTHRFRRSVLGFILSMQWDRHSRGISSTDSFTTIFDIMPTPPRIKGGDYADLLRPGRLDGSVEVMVHPAKDAGSVAGLTRIGDVSSQEFIALAELDPKSIHAPGGYIPCHSGRLGPQPQQQGGPA
ncbi:MAG: ChbG/HpnK family deacetylase, partial [Elusimicrobiota bacterium]